MMTWTTGLLSLILGISKNQEKGIFESSSQRWQATEELPALLNVCFVKPLSGFDKRQIVRSCPRPDVDCVYTPVLDKFVQNLVPKVQSED